MTIKKILHVGPGHRLNGARLPEYFNTTHWQELRFDIDPENNPDIVGSILDMHQISDASIDAIYSAHNIEHVYHHEVNIVLKEFFRALKPDGFALITCPDLKSVCRLVAEDHLSECVYNSPAGPITPLDIIYGHAQALKNGHLYMAHKTGFTEKTLTTALQSAGFNNVATKQRADSYDLWALATKVKWTESLLRSLAITIFPKG